MTEHHGLHNALMRAAICGTDHPANAVTTLMSAAATILSQQFGEDEAGTLMMSMVSEARTEWAKANAN